MKPSSNAHDQIAAARRLARDVLHRWAPCVDEENRFPVESVGALRDAGLFGFMLPERLGGHCSELEAFCRIAAALGEECLSTALIWTMHCQQVAVLAEHAAPSHEHALGAIAVEGALVASVTTEAGCGDLLHVTTPICQEDGMLRIRRHAPIVSYGREAAFYLITMRRAEDRPPNDVSAVLVAPRDGLIEVVGNWDAMGMRGTQSLPMQFDVLVEPNRVLGADFRTVAVKTMVPIGHLGWAASWYGAAAGLVKRFIQIVRNAKGGAAARSGSDLFVSRLAEMRVHLDLVWALIERVARDQEALRKARAPISRYDDISRQIELNNLKLASSKFAFSIADALMELAGMRHGYLRGGELGLERVFRDLRSASLMYHNDRLHQANGALMFVEQTGMSDIWSRRSAAAGTMIGAG